jgi:magnesium chelatase family protein
MPVARTRAVALTGVDGSLVEIEADLANGLPAFTIIGLPDAALGEAKDRVRAASANTGVELPSRKVTVNLSPASLPKHGSGFDVGIAVAALATTGALALDRVAETVHIGELALDGRLRPVAGVLPAVLAARRSGARLAVVPWGNRDEAELVPGIRVVAAANLREVLTLHGAELEAPNEPVEPIAAPSFADEACAAGDLSDVIGHPEAIEALQIAAVGGHHVMMLGPPGAGKTLLASRLTGLLPDLEIDAAIEVSSIRSLAGLGVGSSLVTRPPFEAPHHSATMASLVGGGSGLIRPGAISRAAHGVLFLDEAPEFSGSVLDALRQPLETGEITIHRSRSVARFPAKFQLVLAANPCPCGQAGTGDAECTCTPHTRRRYLARLSGPLLDRIDLRLTVRRVSAAQLTGDCESGLTTMRARERVSAARARTQARWGAEGWRLNAQVPGTPLRSPRWRLAPADRAMLDRALERGAITMRGYDRVVRVAWSIADLEGADRPLAEHVGRALYLRKGI